MRKKANSPKKSAVKKKVAVKKKAVKKPESVIVAPKTPRDQVLSNVDESVRTGKWAVIALRVADGKILLDRTAVNFPKEDIDTALTMIGNDLNKLKVG